MDEEAVDCLWVCGWHLVVPEAIDSDEALGVQVCMLMTLISRAPGN